MRALVITQDFPPSLSAQALSTGKFLAALLEAGLDCDILAAEPRALVDDSPFWGDLFPRVERRPAESTRRCLPWPFDRGKGRLRALRGWRLEVAEAALAMVADRRPDFIFSCAPFVPGLRVGRILAQETGLPLVLRIEDAPGPADLAGQQRWLKRELPEVALALFSCPRLLHHFGRKLRFRLPDVTAVLPPVGWGGALSHDPRHFSGPIRLLHLGALRSKGQVEAASRFLEAFRKSADARVGRYPKAHLILVGDHDPELRAWVRDLRLEDIVSVQPASAYDESLDFVSQADALVLLEELSPEGVVFPDRLCDYSASGKPVLMFSPEAGTVSDLVGGSKHPGFLGQTVDNAAARIVRLVEACAFGRGLDAYQISGEECSPPSVAARFLGITSPLLRRSGTVAAAIARG